MIAIYLAQQRQKGTAAEQWLKLAVLLQGQGAAAAKQNQGAVKVSTEQDLEWAAAQQNQGESEAR